MSLLDKPLSLLCRAQLDREHEPCSGTADDGTTDTPCICWCHHHYPGPSVVLTSGIDYVPGRRDAIGYVELRLADGDHQIAATFSVDAARTFGAALIVAASDAANDALTVEALADLTVSGRPDAPPPEATAALIDMVMGRVSRYREAARAHEQRRPDPNGEAGR